MNRAVLGGFLPPTEGFRLYYQQGDYLATTWFQRWYSSLSAAKAARTRLEKKALHLVIITYQGEIL